MPSSFISRCRLTAGRLAHTQGIGVQVSAPQPTKVLGREVAWYAKKNKNE